ncbi:hypothetical protein [Bacillus subtilis]|uniref:hypothetical protein n=1 Tax=Bacillus subtilis TaxID=1423 RepID=UPI001BA61821|nr:hypothetical protein [Bacillus subtilis]QUG79134.1 hypothetical protein GSN02_06540 [Bacillus subtilis]
MTEIKANSNVKIHVLADETLGGIKREYVEVDRKAEVGEKIVIVAKDDCEEGYKNGDVFTVDREYRPKDGDVECDVASSDSNCDGLIYREEYRVLEPTDIVHIDGPDGTTQRYELTDRKAEVGEEVIHMYEGKSDGVAREVRKVDETSVEVDPFVHNEGVRSGFAHGYYRVLVPVESAEADEPQPVDTVFAIGNLAQEVAKLQRRVFALELTNERQEIVNDRLKDEIDTLHKDNLTLGEELERLKETPKNEACAPIDAPLVFVQRKIGDVFDVYQDGKRLRGIKRIRIDAAMGEVTTHDIEFVSGATEEERP